MYCRFEDSFSFLSFFFFFSFDVKKSSDLQHMDPPRTGTVGRHVVWPWTVPILGMADREFELWTGSNMGSSDLEFRLETGPVRGMADPELAYYSSLGLDPNKLGLTNPEFELKTGPDMGWADLAFSLRTGSNMGLTHPELGLRIEFLCPA